MNCPQTNLNPQRRILLLLLAGVWLFTHSNNCALGEGANSDFLRHLGLDDNPSELTEGLYSHIPIARAVESEGEGDPEVASEEVQGERSGPSQLLRDLGLDFILNKERSRSEAEPAAAASEDGERTVAGGNGSPSLGMSIATEGANAIDPDEFRPENAWVSIERILGDENCDSAEIRSAIQLLEELARREDVAAIKELVEIYDDGELVDQDQVKAFRYAQQGAELGSGSCLVWLGYFYYEGEVVSKDLEKSAQYFAKAVDVGYDDAHSRLGLAYELGEGVPQSYERARELYWEGAKHGDGYAWLYLAYLFDSDDDDPFYDPIEANQYFQNATISENLDDELRSDAFTSLGFNYWKGIGRNKSVPRRLSDFEQS